MLAVGLWAAGISSVVIVTFAIAAMIAPADTLGTTLPRGGWVTALIDWGVCAGVVTLALGRVTDDGMPGRAWAGLVLLVCAIASAVTTEVTVMRWAVARFGVQAADPDLIASASLLSPMVVLVGLAGLASVVLGGSGGVAARAITVVAGSGGWDHAARRADGHRHDCERRRRSRGGGDGLPPALPSEGPIAVPSPASLFRPGQLRPHEPSSPPRKRDQGVTLSMEGRCPAGSRRHRLPRAS